MKLVDILLENTKVIDIEPCFVNESIALFVIPRPEIYSGSKSGFDLMGISFKGALWDKSNPYSGKDWLKMTDVEADIFIRVSAAFDGIRHMQIGKDITTDDIGYFNYPDVIELSRVMLVIRGLEKKYCSDYIGKVEDNELDRI